ncbi:MAG: conserved hypothetical signal peptide protein [Bacteroidetes bacterium]|nr:conserved hypothetical signal peptide protein [Bacteroidota bacterium]
MKGLLTLTMLLACMIVQAQTADDIINKHFDATGGKEKWARVNTIRCTGNYVMGPGMLAPVQKVETNKPSISFYSDFSWQGMTAKNAMRADSGWNYNPFGGKRETDPMSPNELRSAKLDADPQGLLFDYKAKGYTVEYLGTEDMDGSDVHKVRLTTKDGDMMYYYIDADTYYILKIAKRVRFKDKEEKGYTTYSDFRKTDYGIIVPYSNQGVDENGAEQGGPVTYTKVEVNPTIEASIFDKVVKK